MKLQQSQLLGAISAVLFSFISVSAQAALIGVLPATSGGTDFQAYYDTDLDITWAADANINGIDTWANQNTWAAGLTIGGVSGWRLPTTMQPDASCSIQSGGQGFGAGCTGSEMGHLFNVEGISGAAPGSFSNVQSNLYWSGTEFATDPARAWVFNFDSDDQFAGLKDGLNIFAWAVHLGDVSAVPVPAAVWLFGSGLLGLIGLARRRV